MNGSKMLRIGFKQKMVVLIQDLREKEETRGTKSKSSSASSAKSSGSRRSSNGSRSYVRSKLIEEEVIVAELSAEVEYLRLNEIPAQEKEIELAKATGRLKALKRIEEQMNKTPSNLNVPTLNPDAPVYDPGTQRVNDKDEKLNSKSESKVTGKDDALCTLLKQQGAPEVNLEPFDGNALNFHNFIAMFKEVVEKKIDDQRGRLTRLIQFTTGEAKETIRHCIQH